MNGQKYLIPFLIFVLSLLVYSNTFNHGWSLDDEYILAGLPDISEGLKGCFSVFFDRFDTNDYRPLAMFTFALEQVVMGELNPAFSHLINVLIFCCCGWLLFFTLQKLPIQHTTSIAAITVLLFIAHPIHSNVVASLKNRDVLLSFFFSILALNLFLRWMQASKLNWIFFILCSCSLFLGFISKLDSIGMMFVLPFTFLLFKGISLKNVSKSLAMFMFFFLFILLVFRYVLIGVVVPIEQVNSIGSQILFTENPIVASNSAVEMLSYLFTTLFYYLKFFIIPKGYFFYFGFDMIPIKPLFHWTNIVALLVSLVLLFVFIRNLKSNKSISFAIFFLFATLFFASGIIAPVASIVAPRLAFFASVGFCMLVASVWVVYLLPLFKKHVWMNSTRWVLPNISWMFIVILILIYAPFTSQRNLAWKNIYILLETDMPHLTKSFQANRIALAQYHKKSETATANEKRIWQKICLKYSEQAHNVFDEHIYVEEALAGYYYQLGETDNAKQQCLQNIEQFDTMVNSRSILADIYFAEEKYDSAAIYYKSLHNALPIQPKVFYQYTVSLVKAGKSREAIDYNYNLIDRKVEMKEYLQYENLALAHLLSGDTLASAIYFVDAINLGLNGKNVLPMLEDFHLRNNYTEEWESRLIQLKKKN